MFKKLRKNKKAQNTAEYALLISLVVAAIIAMTVYAQRGLQGRVKGAVLYLASETTALSRGGVQYEPYYLSSNYQVIRAEQEQELLDTATTNRESDTFRTRPTGFQQSTYDIRQAGCTVQ